jgi:hypothetical protein
VSISALPSSSLSPFFLLLIEFVCHISRFFPPSSEISDKQVDVTEEQIAEAESRASQLPSVPKTDPSDSEHTQKKQKQKHDGSG